MSERRGLWADYALEITGKGIGEIETARPVIAPDTPVNIAFLGNETHAQRIEVARILRRSGFEPVPIISARRLTSEDDVETLIGGLKAAASPQRFLFVGGDPATAAGPYSDAMTLLESGVLQRHGIARAGIVGYPEGHPKISDTALWQALLAKLAFLRDSGCETEITTQYGFDADAIIGWIARLRDAGIHVPVRIGIPGPARAATLIRFARQFGVALSPEPLGDPDAVVTADRFAARLLEGLERRALGNVFFHLYPFGGIAAAIEWLNRVVAPNHSAID